MSYIAHKFFIWSVWYLSFRICFFIAPTRSQKTTINVGTFVTGVKPNFWCLLRPLCIPLSCKQSQKCRWHPWPPKPWSGQYQIRPFTGYNCQIRPFTVQSSIGQLLLQLFTDPLARLNMTRVVAHYTITLCIVVGPFLWRLPGYHHISMKNVWQNCYTTNPGANPGTKTQVPKYPYWLQGFESAILFANLFWVLLPQSHLSQKLQLNWSFLFKSVWKLELWNIKSKFSSKLLFFWDMI